MTQIERGGRSSGDWDTPVRTVEQAITQSLERDGARRSVEAGASTPPEQVGQCPQQQWQLPH